MLLHAWIWQKQETFALRVLPNIALRVAIQKIIMTHLMHAQYLQKATLQHSIDNLVISTQSRFGLYPCTGKPKQQLRQRIIRQRER